MYEDALDLKLVERSFAQDHDDLLSADAPDVDLDAGTDVVRDRLIDAMRRRAANVP